MSEPTTPSTPGPPATPAAPTDAGLPRPRWQYVAVSLLAAAGTLGVALLLNSVAGRKEEARRVVLLADVKETTVDPAEWGKTFPRQYDGYRRTVDVQRTRHGGSEAFQKLDEDPRWRQLFAGYAFSIDYREERGHAYMLSDQRETERVHRVKQPGACLQCHASVLPAYRAEGIARGAPGTLEQPLFSAEGRAQLERGFEAVCAMPFEEATGKVTHPVSCVDCHDPATLGLRVTRPGFLRGIAALASGTAAVPHLPSIERWRQGPRRRDYDPNEDASRQELRAMACGQCHVEYHFAGPGKLLTYPWAEGLQVEAIERFYDARGHTDWTHPTSGARLLKAQHPEFELWSQGIHARSGVSCADCHMPYTREGAQKVSDHHVRSPMLNVARACLSCHPYGEAEVAARVQTIQDRTAALLSRAEDAVVAAIGAIAEARAAGADDAGLAAARDLHRRAQWRLDFVAAENSMGFHAPQEAARILAEAIDLARQGQVSALSAKAR